MVGGMTMIALLAFATRLDRAELQISLRNSMEAVLFVASQLIQVESVLEFWLG